MLNMTGPQQGAIAEARKAINEILAAPHVDNATKVEALRSLHSLCGQPVSISNCTFSQSGS